ncbi:hypothetical protein [Sinanaerobacter chloroacetimidivorans]|uniref:hypothetical protein n=1 Tax=Sinanaerobacter chloroacetimidivorans TaxID=2818044 RepID=UPI001D046CD8|nr:hypothetical protein [Sinanaerobacter chloroacetimidivorans]
MEQEKLLCIKSTRLIIITTGSNDTAVEAAAIAISGLKVINSLKAAAAASRERVRKAAVTATNRNL